MAQTDTTTQHNKLQRTRLSKFSARLYEWVYWQGGIARLGQRFGWAWVHASYRRYRPHKKYGIQQPILVYQKGKNASMSLYASLRALDLDVPIYHVHYLNRLEEIRVQAMQTTFRDAFLPELARSEKIRAQFLQRPNAQWIVLSPIRNPVERGLSAYFEHLDDVVPEFEERARRGEIAVEELYARFVNEITAVQSFGRDWFDEQIKEVFGIDVYAVPFSHARHYQIYENARARLLVLRYENLAAALQPAMQEFLNLSNFELKRENVGANKAYAELYRKFKEQKFPRAWLEQMLSTRFAQHFYTPQEIAETIARWS